MRAVPVELTIFDCDGVLIDSEILAVRAIVACLAEHGISVSSEQFMDRYIGVSSASMLADLEARLERPLPAGIEEKMRERVAASFEAELQVMPGIASLLDVLTCRSCVASSSAPARLRHSLSLVKLYDRFDPHVFSATQVARGKPAPDLFLFAAKQMGVAPTRCAVVEDSVAGVQAAKAAGMLALGFCGGGHCGDGYGKRLLDAGADLIVDRLGDLTAALPC